MTVVFTIVIFVSFLRCIDASVDYVRHPDDAHVYIGAFFSVYFPNGQNCSGELDHNSLQEFEAVRWIIDKLNQKNYLGSGRKIGVHACKTCGIPEKALECAIEFSQMYMNSSTQSPILFGLLSPIKSSETKQVSRLFSSLPRQSRLLVLSFSATSQELANREVYQNFYRVIPPDNIQVEVMLKLMIQLKWNYVAIIYEDDDYGRDAGKMLLSKAGANGICVAVSRSFKTYNYKEDFKDFFSGILKFQVGGIVHIGSDVSLLALLGVFESPLISFDIEIITSESNGLNPSYFQIVEGRYSNIALGALVSSPPKSVITEFGEYWKNIKNKTFASSWIDTTKYKAASDQSVYVNYAIKAVLVLTHLFTTVRQRTCSGTTMCPLLYQLEKQRFIDEIQTLQTNLTKSFPFTQDMFKNTISDNITFDESGEINYQSEPDKQIYEVYNLQCVNRENCQFLKVGDYRNNTLELKKDKIKTYRIDNFIEHSSLPSAQCPDDTDCDKCIPNDLPDQVLFIEGDWYVVAVTPVYKRNDRNTLFCSNDIRNATGDDIAESIRFAVEEINNSNNSHNLSGQKIGLILLNDCGSELVIKEKIMRFHKGEYELRPGLKSSTILHRILGYVGSLDSSMSTAVASTLSEIKLVQVSFGSTSTLLSNRILYPYFLRIPTADDKQAKVIIDIVKALKSNQIQVIYTEGSYGEGGLLALQNVADQKSVCIVGHKVPVTDDYSKFNGLLANLRKTPHAKLVVTFIRTHLITPVVSAVIENMNEREFIFIGSETWGQRNSLLQLQNNRKLIGSLSILLELPIIQTFDSFIAERDIYDPTDPWFRLFWETRDNCIFPGSFQRAQKKNSNGDTRKCNITVNTFQQEPWIPFAIAATRALVLGAESFLNLEKCRTFSPSCTERDAYKMVEYMKKNVMLDLYNSGKTKRVFDDNGDGLVEYTILHIKADQSSGVPSYEKVGFWSKARNTQIDTQALLFETDVYKSVCFTEVACNQCFPKAGKSDPEDDRTQLYAIIALACILCLALLVIFILVRKVRAKLETSENDNGGPYAEPDDIGSYETTPEYLTAQFQNTSFRMTNQVKTEAVPPPCTSSAIGRNGENLDSGFDPVQI